MSNDSKKHKGASGKPTVSDLVRRLTESHAKQAPANLYPAWLAWLNDHERTPTNATSKDVVLFVKSRDGDPLDEIGFLEAVAQTNDHPYQCFRDAYESREFARERAKHIAELHNSIVEVTRSATKNVFANLSEQIASLNEVAISRLSEQVASLSVSVDRGIAEQMAESHRSFIEATRDAHKATISSLSEQAASLDKSFHTALADVHHYPDAYPGTAWAGGLNRVVEQRLVLKAEEYSLKSAVKEITLLNAVAERPERRQIEMSLSHVNYAIKVRNDSNVVVAIVTGRLAHQRRDREVPTNVYSFDEWIPDGLEPQEVKVIEFSKQHDLPYDSSEGMLVVHITDALDAKGESLTHTNQKTIGFLGG